MLIRKPCFVFCILLRRVQSTEEESHQLLDYYVEERGGNFLDVAEMYPAPASDPVSCHAPENRIYNSCARLRLLEQHAPLH